MTVEVSDRLALLDEALAPMGLARACRPSSAMGRRLTHREAREAMTLYLELHHGMSREQAAQVALTTSKRVCARERSK